jgi:hypothetical protein
MLENFQELNQEAMQNIDGTAWVSNNTLPPCYRIVISNLLERANNMFSIAREKHSRSECVDDILNKMLCSISTLCTNIKGKHAQE